MAYGTDRAKYEGCLSRAHRQLYYARDCAEDLNDVGAQHDLTQLLQEVTRLAEDSLRGRARRSARTQASQTL